ncbi:hypothetical protein MACH26_29650 [Planctobacterium marinum]|uniref:Uncharacterized protein n=1 Tax=Planctobacterium marinum TaxID=1631968 RepID=A0AA48KTD9_9ALTE|nr:hypothetical protein MACH26_29650 [Planctobacterium marinum]
MQSAAEKTMGEFNTVVMAVSIGWQVHRFTLAFYQAGIKVLKTSVKHLNKILVLMPVGHAELQPVLLERRAF